MTPITFYKFQGTGNDFILLDDFHQSSPQLTAVQIKQLCNRHFGVGADGLMLMSKAEGYDFRMVYFNADGQESSMCGNGGRCMIKFAHLMGVHKTYYKFLATDGPHEAEIELDGKVRLKMLDVNQVEYHSNYAILHTGSPHFVRFADHVAEIDVPATGRDIRYSAEFKEKGINVNFVETIDEDAIFVRTYERGVEDETLSCGTGVTAAALLSAHNENGFNTVDVKTRGGKLTVEFEKHDDQHFSDIWLCGPAQLVFKGEIVMP